MLAIVQLYKSAQSQLMSFEVLISKYHEMLTNQWPIYPYDLFHSLHGHTYSQKYAHT